MSTSLVIDLFCGLGGWAEGFLAEGYRVVGFDVERHDYGTGGYPGQLVLQDVLTLHGSQFKDAAVIVASPPCQAYSYMAMPWSRAKKMAAWYRDPEGATERIVGLTALLDACFRLQREASEAAGREIPLVLENVKGAQTWVGRAKWHYGSFYLWGDVPALMPTTASLKNSGGSWFGERDGKRLERNDPRDMRKNEGGEWVQGGHNHPGKAMDGLKRPGRTISEGFNNWPKDENGVMPDGTKQHGSGAAWFDNGIYKKGSRSQARKAASAQIAKIPFPLSNWIAKVYHP